MCQFFNKGAWMCIEDDTEDVYPVNKVWFFNIVRLVRETKIMEIDPRIIATLLEFLEQHVRSDACSLLTAIDYLSIRPEKPLKAESNGQEEVAFTLLVDKPVLDNFFVLDVLKGPASLIEIVPSVSLSPIRWMLEIYDRDNFLAKVASTGFLQFGLEEVVVTIADSILRVKIHENTQIVSAGMVQSWYGPEQSNTVTQQVVAS